MAEDDTTWGMNDVDSAFVTRSFQDLFSTLSPWKVDGDLVLDISIYSRSDSDHWFKYLEFGPDMPPGRSSPSFRQSEVSTQSLTDLYDDPAHGWRAGRRETALASRVIHRVFDEIECPLPCEDEELEKKCWQRLPLLPAITGVYLRQQTRRRWKPTDLAQMFARFPNLEELWYEPWKDEPLMQHFTDKCEYAAISLTLPSDFPVNDSNPPVDHEMLFDSLHKGLRTMILFENFNQDYDTPKSWDLEAVRTRKENTALARKLARTSTDLEVLSASYIVDARHFFDARRESCIRPNLTSLALTSSLLGPDASSADIDGMLLNAAAAALRMPKIQTIEIWNGKEGLVMLFRYRTARDGQSVAVTLRGTSEVILGPTVAQAWEAVALQHRHGRVKIESDSIDGRIIKSHGDALCHLKLSMQVIRSVSLRQIVKEDQLRTGPSDTNIW
ncbi:conserved hypothetical protein [Verticillium alfalfae VaMs.102]|uniref:DUF6546 domain-containing protein n=1 Tax=Verticillium alfalfae (strain VaMs.102 / ATCC MYA-4576 / FGSC 10136) TaxID=526221 RepID=C9SHC4_VERA1|nr:conserved hypothetical protein [Verticillium alfalfae VaMs.102]EEY17718.1 conserved hypothetical protein [Verticillium alfalfae VaMs.102]